MPEMIRELGGFPKIGVPFLGGPNNKDHSILGSKLGSILGSPYMGKLPILVHRRQALCAQLSGSFLKYGDPQYYNSYFGNPRKVPLILGNPLNPTPETLHLHMSYGLNSEYPA